MNTNRSTRRDFLRQASLNSFGLASLLTFTSADLHTDDHNKKMNFLFVVVEDMFPYHGCYGYDFIKTPNIDKFAKSGVAFKNAFCQYPLCNPSRTSFMSGLRPETTKVFKNEHPWMNELPAGSIMPEYFKRHGYETVTAGKIMHHFDRSEYRDIYDKRIAGMWDITLKPAETTGKSKYKPGKRPSAPIPSRFDPNSSVVKYVNRSCEWGATGVAAGNMSDGRNARAAAEYLSKQHEKPFLLCLGISAPHYSFRAPDRFHDMYLPEEIKMPEFDRKVFEKRLNSKDYLFNVIDQVRLTDEEKKEVRSSYFAEISYADWCFGQVMNALDNGPNKENTVVVFISDHGMHTGENGLWRKETDYCQATRVSFIARVPGTKLKNIVSDKPVELLDIYPAFCEAAGIPLPEHLEGKSFLPMMNDPNARTKKAAYTRRGEANKTVITEKYRYSELPTGSELYDLVKDPTEQKNVAGDPAYQAVEAEMKELLK